MTNDLSPAGIFRYADWLPPTHARVSLGEGSTPVVALPRLGAHLGIAHLYAKLEGCNPTGSYKDRVAAMSLSLGLDQNRKAWIATSSGNAGTSFAAYGSRAGLPGFLCVVPNIPREKLLPVLACRNTTVIKVAGVGSGGTASAERAMFASVQEAAVAHNLFLGVTAHAFNEQGMRGADTIAYELIDAGFDDAVVYVPTGGGGLAAAISRGAMARGAKLRIVAAQPSGCAPIAAHLQRKLESPAIDRCDTQISGLQLPTPPDGELATRLIQATNGWGTDVDDEAVFASQQDLAAFEGILAEPASAAALAAAACDRSTGRLNGADTVVLILTATGLKHLASFEATCTPPDTVAVEALSQTISSWAIRNSANHD